MAFKRWRFLRVSGLATAGLGLSQLPSVANPSGSKKLVPRRVKVGILHSLSGTMAFTERSVVDATQLAIEEINQAGGVLGRSINAIVAEVDPLLA
ncbi:MAG: transporter substrate-binding protein [Synechococcales bacterium]|nr:transporter substrate-binding protein [Synechococcales bacterium]